MKKPWRITVSLTDYVYEKLTEISMEEGRSKAELVREAIAKLIQEHAGFRDSYSQKISHLLDSHFVDQ